MRRSTAAAVGTLTGAALIIGVRLSVATPATVAAPPAADLAGAGLDAGLDDPSAAPKPAGSTPASKAPSKKGSEDEDADAGSSGEAGGSGLKAGDFKGTAVKNPYGTVQVTIRVADGKITGATATYPTTADSATINPPAVATLKQATLQAQSADVDAVSGATFTSESYVKSLQAALDKAGA